MKKILSLLLVAALVLLCGCSGKTNPSEPADDDRPDASQDEPAAPADNDDPTDADGPAENEEPLNATNFMQLADEYGYVYAFADRFDIIALKKTDDAHLVLFNVGHDVPTPELTADDLIIYDDEPEDSTFNFTLNGTDSWKISRSVKSFSYQLKNADPENNYAVFNGSDGLFVMMKKDCFVNFLKNGYLVELYQSNAETEDAAMEILIDLLDRSK